jgi:hypothetical protein
MTRTDAREILRQQVFVDGRYKPFGEFTDEDVRARADELAGAVGWGPMARIGGVARAWRELAGAMTTAGVATVSELGDDAALAYGERLWVVVPGGGFL